MNFEGMPISKIVEGDTRIPTPPTGEKKSTTLPWPERNGRVAEPNPANVVESMLSVPKKVQKAIKNATKNS